MDDIRADLGLPDAVAMHAHWLDREAPLRALANRLPVRLRSASARRRREFLAGRLCASAALAKAGCDDGAWLAQDDDMLPTWPSGWTGSISHSPSLALAMACPAGTGTLLGLDVEEMIGYRDIHDIASLVARADELAMLDGMSPVGAVITLFSAKECLYKALYPRTRRFREFSAARLVDAAAGHLRLRLEEDWGTRWPAGREVDVRHVHRHAHAITVLHLDGPPPLTRPAPS